MFNLNLLRGINRTQNNSPNTDRKEFKHKEMPKQALLKIKEKMKTKDHSIDIGREFAFGDPTAYKVKKLRNQHFLNTAKNTLNIK